MRWEILLNENWRFHKGDIVVPPYPDKGPIYSQSKLERKLQGPAAYKYCDGVDVFVTNGELKNDGWRYVSLPHDYVVAQDLDLSENNTLGYLHYDVAWYRRHFLLDENHKGKRLTLRFD